MDENKYIILWILCLIGFGINYAANYAAWPAYEEFDLDPTVVEAVSNAGAELAFLDSDLDMRDNQMNISRYSNPEVFGKSLNNGTVMCFLAFHLVGTSGWNIETTYYQMRPANTLAVYKEAQYRQATNMAYALDDRNSSIRQLLLYKSIWYGFWKGVGQLIAFAFFLILFFLLVNYLDNRIRAIRRKGQ